MVDAASLLLQAYVTSREGRRKHSQAAHTHVNPNVGLGGAGGWLLTKKQKISGEELQLGLIWVDTLDHLQS